MFLTVLVFPVAEIFVLMKVASRIGFGYTLFLLILSAVIGAYLAKLQGRITFLKIQQCFNEGRIPTREMVDGLLIFLGGVFFMIPGFISDIAGLFLIFPLTRWFVLALILAKTKAVVEERKARSEGFGNRHSSGSSQRRERPSSGDVEDAQILD